MNGYPGLTSLMAFNHVPVGLSVFSGASNLPAALGPIGTFTDLPWQVDSTTAFATTGKNINNGIVSDSEGIWMTNQGSATSPLNQSGSFSGRGICYPLSGAGIDLTKPRFLVGFRLKIITNSTTGLGMLYLKANLAASGSFDTNRVIIGNPVSGVSYGLTAGGVSAYMEVMFDRVNNLITVFQNGIQVDQYTPSAALSTLTSAAVLQFGSSGLPTTGWNYQYKDIYFMNDLGDGTFGPLGSITPTILSVKTATGGYAASDAGSGGTVISDLNTLITGAGNLAAPAAQSPKDVAAPLVVTVDTTLIPAGSKLLAMSAHVSSYRDPSSQMFMTASMVDQATPTPNQLVLPQINYPLANTVIPYKTMVPALTTNLDGSAINAGKLAQLSLKFTPTPQSLAG